jgi:hypothetical protein
VLLDVITGDEQWADWSAREIAAAMDAGRVVINPLIYAAVSVGYQRVEELEELLPAADYEREPLPYLAGFAAGKAFVRYWRGGGAAHPPPQALPHHESGKMHSRMLSAIRETLASHAQDPPDSALILWPS